MQVRIERLWRKPGYTIGRVYIDGKFFCNSLEDRDRGLRQDMSVAEVQRIKVVGETAIPTGRYKVGMTYSGRFRRIMPQIMNVPGFSGVRIHAGNTAADTSGCILLGMNTKQGMLTNSRETCVQFEKLLAQSCSVCDLEIV